MIRQSLTVPPAVVPHWVEVLACPICGSGDWRPFESLDSDGDRVDYRLCKNCGTVYQSPRMSDEELDAYYLSNYVTEHQRAESVTEKELRVQAGRARHLARLISREVSTVSRHLDIGSSTGKLMEAVRQAYGCESVGIEPAEIYRSYCAGKGLRVYPDLTGLSEASEGRFDLITMAHVMEHLPDPVGYLGELRQRWLNPGGALVAEVPNLFGHFCLERPHLLCFHAATLRRALEVAGFQTLRVVRHGAPRSHLIPLYLTAIAKPAREPTIGRGRSVARGVQLRRSLGMAWHRLTSRLLPRWAWLPLPELERVP
jgi:SAM-dependent methyltransferase